MRQRGWIVLLLLVWACVSPAPVALPPASDGSSGDPALRRRVEGFYLRLAHRRFNAVETYNDRIMREHFLSANAFLEYYADLAQSFSDGHFEKRRPESVRIVSIAFETEDVADVQIEFVGQDRRPLRPGQVRVERSDRWIREAGDWWIEPGAG